MIQRPQRLHVDAFPLIASVAALVEAFCGFFANSVEVFLRRPGTFGVRYLSSLGVLTTVVLAGFTKGSLEFVMSLYEERGGLLHKIPLLLGAAVPEPQLQDQLFNIYAYAVLAMGVAHLLAQRWVNRHGLRYHTFSSGIPVCMPLYSLLPWGSDLVTAKTVYEPLLCFGLSYAMQHLDVVLGSWLSFASVCMFIRCRLHYGRARAAELDAFDALLEAEDLMASVRVLSGRAAVKTTAQTAAVPKNRAGAPGADAGSILDGLSSTLRQDTT